MPIEQCVEIGHGFGDRNVRKSFVLVTRNITCTPTTQYHCTRKTEYHLYSYHTISFVLVTQYITCTKLYGYDRMTMV